MTRQREILLHAATNEVGLPNAFAKLLLAECPWLDGSEEVNESFGPDLLAEQAAKLGVSHAQTEQFIYAYNALVRAHTSNGQPR
jgi:hypothetical protein